jgi:hypothetical protein
VALVSLLGRALHAAPGDPVGGQFQLNDFTTLAQSQPSVAPDGGGGFVAVWQSFASTGTDADAFSVQVRRFTATGTPLGAETQVNTYTTGSQREPEVTALGGGGFVVIWQSGGSASDPAVSIMGRLFDAAGAAVGGEFQVNTYTTDAQYSPAVTTDGTGGFVVVWNSEGSAGTDVDGVSIQARRFDASGTPAGPEFQVNSYTTGAQHYPDVGSDGAGGFVVVWTSDGSAGTDAGASSIQGQRFGIDGSPVAGEFQVNTYTTSEQVYPSVTGMGAGGFVVVWMSEGSSGTDTSGLSVQMQRYDSAGVPAGGQFQVNTYTTTTQDFPRVAPDGAGGFIAMWRSVGSTGTDQSGSSAQARRFDGTGFPLAGEFQVNTYSTSDQQPYGACPDGSGGFVIVWDSLGSETDNDGRSIQAQRYEGSGMPTTTTTLLVSSTSSTTTAASSTTTSTAPFGAQALSGQALQLRAKPGRADKSTLALVSKDASLTLGRGNGSPDDPVVNGGTLAIASVPGGFAARHDLTGAWSYLGKSGQNKGYKWKSASLPIRTIVIKRGKLVKIAGRGASLGFDLDDNPNPVRVELGIGGHLYCFELAGEGVVFKAGKRYAARRAGAPGACP